MTYILRHLLNIQSILAQQRSEILRAKNIVGEMQYMTEGLQGVKYENNKN